MFNNFASMLGDGDTLNITITRKGDRMIVSLVPKLANTKEDIQNKITPLVLSGTPDELEEGFISTITSPIQKATGIISNANEFEKSAEKAVTGLKSTGKAASDSKKKEEEERKANYGKAMKRADEHEKAGQLREAVSALEDADKYATGNHSAIQGRIDKLNKILSKPSLFGSDEDEQLPTEDYTDYSQNKEEE